MEARLSPGAPTWLWETKWKCLEGVDLQRLCGCVLGLSGSPTPNTHTVQHQHLEIHSSERSHAGGGQVRVPTPQVTAGALACPGHLI